MRGIWPVAALVVLAACGTAPAATAPPTRYQANATVLADASHGPQLCAIVMESLPPQCGGPDVVGWDWNAVEHSDQGGTRWGEYHVVGTWDGERLTLTEPARPAEPPEAPRDRTAFTTPCQKPAGGWRAVDPAKATQEAMTAALARAERLPGYAGGWLDQSYLDDIDGYEPDDPRSAERHANDPLRLVLNLRFTGDPATREPEIREVWGGALCLSQAEHTAAELRTLQEKVQEELTDAYSVSADERAGHVRAGVWAATPELRRHVDATYGKGMVVLDGLLQPVGP